MRLSVGAQTDPTDRPTDRTGSDLFLHFHLTGSDRSPPSPATDHLVPVRFPPPLCQLSDQLPADHRHIHAEPPLASPAFPTHFAPPLPPDRRHHPPQMPRRDVVICLPFLHRCPSPLTFNTRSLPACFSCSAWGWAVGFLRCLDFCHAIEYLTSEPKFSPKGIVAVVVLICS